MIGLSPAGTAALSGANGFGLGTSLATQVKSETDEERKRREAEASLQRAGLSPAGRALTYGGTLLSF